MSIKEFRLVGPHSEDLNDGRVIGVGENFKADEADDRVKQLVEDGHAVLSGDQIHKDAEAKKKAAEAKKKEENAS